MKLLWRIFPALFVLCVFTAMAEASTEWVRLVTDDIEGYVLSVDGNNVMIDASISRGARKGGLYLVYSDGGDVFDTNGAYVGRSKTPLAVLKVREPSTTHSFGVIVPPSNGYLVQPGDKIEPISATRAKRLKFARDRAIPAPGYAYDVEGYIPTSPYPDKMFAIAPPVALPAATPVPAAVPAQLPLPPVTTVHVPAPPQPLTAPVTTIPAVASAPAGYYYADLPSYSIDTVRVAAAQPSVQGVYPQPPASLPTPAVRVEPPHPPSPPNPANYGTMLDYDANKIADARLIRTFPLAQADMNALEIQHRGAWDLYSKQRYLEAFESFAQQSLQFQSNYLSPYWAGMCALRLKNLEVADAWFNRALEINPYYEPARNAKNNAAQYIMQDSRPKPQPVKPAPAKPRRRARRSQ